MKVRSTIPLIYQADRLGTKQEIIQIDLTIVNKDDNSKTYTLNAVDSVVFNPGLENEAIMQIFEKPYIKTYEEFDQQREILLSVYGEETILTGSELDDFLLQKALLYNLGSDPIYGGSGNDWEAYK